MYFMCGPNGMNHGQEISLNKNKVSLTKDNKFKNRFSLVTNERSLSLAAVSFEETEDWFNAINNAIKGVSAQSDSCAVDLTSRGDTGYRTVDNAQEDLERLEKEIHHWLLEDEIPRVRSDNSFAQISPNKHFLPSLVEECKKWDLKLKPLF